LKKSCYSEIVEKNNSSKDRSNSRDKPNEFMMQERSLRLSEEGKEGKKYSIQLLAPNYWHKMDLEKFYEFF